MHGSLFTRAELVGSFEGDERTIPTDNPQNAKLWQKWKIKCGKALFALRKSVNK